MEKTSIKAINKTYLFSSVITFLISFYPKIEDIWKIILLITALGLLITTYFFSYINSIDKIEEEINNIKNKMEIDEKLLNSLKDIVILDNLKK